MSNPWDESATKLAPVSEAMIATMTRDQMLMRWQLEKQRLAEAKAAEAMLRLAIVNREFGAADEGTHRRALGKGYELKAVIKYNYSLDTDATETALEKIERSGPEGKFIAERLVSWKPSLSVSEWRKLPEKLSKLFAPALTIKPGLPELEIVPPKGAK